ncbi:hypothetical protein Tco_0301879, partial [Tanacetum coccineum]
LGKASENTSASTLSVNTGSESVNTGSFDLDDSPMPELEIFHRSETGIFDEASYDEEGEEPKNIFQEQHGDKRGTIDKNLFIKGDKKDIMLVQVYVDDIIFGSAKKYWCVEFKALMKS